MTQDEAAASPGQLVQEPKTWVAIMAMSAALAWGLEPSGGAVADGHPWMGCGQLATRFQSAVSRLVTSWWLR